MSSSGLSLNFQRSIIFHVKIINATSIYFSYSLRKFKIGSRADQPPAHMTSTKNSLGLPMAKWKDCRLAVSSGGTEARSRTGGAPGGPPEAGGSMPGWGCGGG